MSSHTTLPLLASATLKNSSFNIDSNGNLHLNFDSSPNLLLFQERPGIGVYSKSWRDLTTPESWSSIFGDEAKFFSFLDNNDTLSEITLSRPIPRTGGGFSAAVIIDGALPPINAAKTTSWFSDLSFSDLASQVTEKGLQANHHNTDSSNNLPYGADFMAQLGPTSVAFNADNSEITIEATNPGSLASFTAHGTTAPNSLEMRQFAVANTWDRLFGSIDPNAALSFSDGNNDYQAIFKMSEPRLRKNGSISIRGNLLFEDNSAQDTFFGFISSDRSFHVDDSTLLIDSSGYKAQGSVDWVEIGKAIDLLTEWSNKHPNALCDSAGAAGAILGGLSGIVDGFIGGTAAGAGSGALAGFVIGSWIEAPADLTGVPEISGAILGGLSGASLGGFAGSTALGLVGGTIGYAGFESLCGSITGNTDVDTFIENQLEMSKKILGFGTTATDDLTGDIKTVANTVIDLAKDAHTLLHL